MFIWHRAHWIKKISYFKLMTFILLQIFTSSCNFVLHHGILRCGWPSVNWFAFWLAIWAHFMTSTYSIDQIACRYICGLAFCDVDLRETMPFVYQAIIQLGSHFINIIQSYDGPHRRTVHSWMSPPLYYSFWYDWLLAKMSNLFQYIPLMINGSGDI